MGEIIASRIDPSELTIDLTARLQRIALLGWQASMPGRSVDELRTRFNPQDNEHLHRTRLTYLEFAKQTAGGLLVAYDTSRLTGSTDPVGFALSKNDVSGSAVQRMVKRLVRPDKVYAHLRHVCAEIPRQGIGSTLVAESLRSFRPEQMPTAYIFDESALALGAFQAWGFEADPPLQQATPLEGYFEGGDPVYQKRYTARSAEDVINLIDQ